VQVAVPAPDGVNTPAEVIVPPVAVHVTAGLYAPVPVTVAVQVEFCAVVIAEGVAVTATFVIVTGTAVTVTVAEPEIFAYPTCAEFAVHVAVPAPDGVNTPPEVIVPPVAVHVTAEL